MKVRELITELLKADQELEVALDVFGHLYDSVPDVHTHGPLEIAVFISKKYRKSVGLVIGCSLIEPDYQYEKKLVFIDKRLYRKDRYGGGQP